MHSVSFLKLGGAVITHKDIPESVRTDVLERLASEIAHTWRETGKPLVIGNGAGSFAHVPAAQYKIMDGFVGKESCLGMAITQDAAARLNRIVVAALLAHGVPAVSLAPSASLITKKRNAAVSFTDVLEEYLKKGLIPVVYGDVIVDQIQGCTIWSTDRVFSFFAKELTTRGWIIERILHVTEAEGVWKNKKKEIYPLITEKIRQEVKEKMVDVKGFDVTGGMWHKIEESLALANLGIETRILSGLTQNSIYDTFLGNTTIGTCIAKAKIN